MSKIFKRILLMDEIRVSHDNKTLSILVDQCNALENNINEVYLAEEMYSRKYTHFHNIMSFVHQHGFLNFNDTAMIRLYDEEDQLVGISIFEKYQDREDKTFLYNEDSYKNIGMVGFYVKPAFRGLGYANVLSVNILNKVIKPLINIEINNGKVPFFNAFDKAFPLINKFCTIEQVTNMNCSADTFDPVLLGINQSEKKSTLEVLLNKCNEPFGDALPRAMYEENSFSI